LLFAWALQQCSATALPVITAIAQCCKKILSQNPGGCTCTPLHLPAGAHDSG